MPSQTTHNDATRIARYSAAVFLTGLVVLGWGIDSTGIAAAYSDPIAHIRAQDEAVYTSAAIGMTKNGDWLSPKVMGRLFLFKPPLLMWMSALSIRVLGVSLLSVRLPVLLLGAAGAAAVFAWAARARSVTAGIAAAGLLLLSPFWQTFSRLCYTDMPASSFAALALVGVVFDPQLNYRQTRIVFGILGAASILSKSVAGVLPFAALLLYCAAIHRESRPRLANIAEVALMAILVVAPWHVYQALVHPQWFWADYVQLQLLGIGFHATHNGIFDRPFLFYAQRLIQMDPLIALLGLLGLAGAVRVARSRQDPPALLAICWTAVTLLALLAFQNKSLPYVVFLLPPLCVLGVVCGPRHLDRRASIVSSVLALLFVAKIVANGEPWSLRPAAPPLDGAAAMRAYYDLNRDAELISVDPDDEFYSATIPIEHIRYCFPDPSGAVAEYIPYYVPLGIIVSAEQFADLPALQPIFEKRLREWGLNSPEPVATAITLRTRGELAIILRARPGSDFYLPSTWDAAGAGTGPTHQLVRYSKERVFLLSRTARPRATPRPAIPLPW